jgi:hypothetical protein
MKENQRIIKQIKEELQNVYLLLQAELSNKFITLADARLYSSAIEYYQATQKSVRTEMITKARSALLIAINADADKWFKTELNKPIQNYFSTKSSLLAMPWTLALIVAMAIAFDQDAKSAAKIFVRLCETKAKLDISVRLNTEGDTLVHIAARLNSPQLIECLFTNKVFNAKQLGAPNLKGENARHIAYQLKYIDVSEYIDSVTRPQISKFSSNLFNSNLTQSLLTPTSAAESTSLDL